MNISITNACNRRCKYCFQKEWYLSKDIREMSVESFRELIAWVGNKTHFNLLGGEPLLHSRLADLLQIVKINNKQCTLITNLSAPIDHIERYYKDNTIASMMINADYSAVQKQLFLNNLETIFKNKVLCSISTTLLPDTASQLQSLNRLLQIREMYKDITGSYKHLAFRISPYSPNGKAFKIHNFSNDLINFIHDLRCSGEIGITMDCHLNRCELDQYTERMFQNVNIRIPRVCNECDCAFDILVDGSIIYCSSAREIKLDNWRDYPTLKDARKALAQKYNQYMQQHNGCSNSCSLYNDCVHACAGKVNQYKDHVIQFYN